MKNFILFSMLFVGLMLTSCSAIQIITEPGTETTPSKTPTSTKTTKKTNKVDMKTTSPKQGTKPRETKVISKPKAKPKSKKSNKSGKVIKKPSKKPTSNTSNNSMSQKQTSKPVVSRTKQASKRVIKPTPKKGVKARPTKRVVKATPTKKVIKATPTKRVIKATPTKRVIKPTTKKAVVHTQKKTVKKVKPKVAKIALDQPRYNFGTIKEGTIIKRDFRFTNVGEADLLIEIATGSCGCTVPEWPIKPIKPGQSEVIHVTFDSTDKEYDTRVEVNIVANTEPIVTEIIMTGKVIPKRDFKKKKG